MSIIKEVRGFKPQLGANCFVAENATLIGDFKCGDNCSFWFNAVLRGDVNAIRLGNNVNVQDGVIIHCTFEKSKTIVGNNVSIGHNAIVHGCIIEDNVLVGMGAIVMDNAHLKSGSIIAAGAVVLENQIIESQAIYGGIPAKKLKNVDQSQAEFFINRTAKNYIQYASWYKK